MDLLERDCNECLGKEIDPLNDSSVELNTSLIKYLLESVKRSDTGRLIMPLLWNAKVKHLLGHNFDLARNILYSNLKKLKKNTENLYLADDGVRELRDLGIIEPILNLEQYLRENPEYSFLPHMSIFKPHKETTKCRMVFLSNLCDKGKGGNAISHNQAMYSGPCVNQKLLTSLMLLRFDLKLLCFDLKKAFLQIQLPETDQSKLLFLWYKNVRDGNFEVQAFKNVRLSFGLRCSPTILMIGLYYILMNVTEGEDVKVTALKKQIYNLIYMDNGALTVNSTEELVWAYESLDNIFNPYCFELQQFCTNDELLRTKLEEVESTVNFFGVNWNCTNDTLFVTKKSLNVDACTRRKVLQTIAAQFDPFNVDAPIMNRARLYLHTLQTQAGLGWDERLSESQVREWRNISKQVNSSIPLTIPRFVGKRESSYKLIAFTDSSGVIYGTVVYIQDLSTGDTNFLMAKNRIVNRQLESKTIPALELMGMVLGTETLMDLAYELGGSHTVVPIRITQMALYTDSLVCLNWLNSFSHKLEKMNKRSVFVRNRLDKLTKLCEKFPVEFSFVGGYENPADLVTRPYSYKQIVKTNYLSGPEFLQKPDGLNEESLRVIVPDPLFSECNSGEDVSNIQVSLVSSVEINHLVNVHNLSSFRSIVSVQMLVREFIDILKNKVRTRKGEPTIILSKAELYSLSFNNVIMTDQRIHYSEVFNYFESNTKVAKLVPNIVLQLNLYRDGDGLLRVGSKMPRNRRYAVRYFPLLLVKDSEVTRLLVRDTHLRQLHSGLYSVLNEVRKKYWIPSCFSVVKSVLRQCVVCRRYNSRTVKLNQSSYRDVRLNPSTIPFSNIFLDYIGPFNVKLNSVKVKVWILCITCMFTRAINLKISLDLTTAEFLRSFQIHTFEYGVPQLVFSDLGTQIVAGANTVQTFFNDSETKDYFREHGASVTEFIQYPKGCSKLGSMVESCVKLTKRLLMVSIRTNVLKFRDFEFLVAQSIHIVNRRPIAFKDSLRDVSGEIMPCPITPELLLHGYDLLSINLVPSLQVTEGQDVDPDFRTDPVTEVVRIDCQLARVRAELLKIYHEEFIGSLLYQATNSKSRYRPVCHHPLKVGDLVLLKEPNTKPTNYPMGIVLKVSINDLGETTEVTLRKGASSEIVRRHSSVLIPFLQENSVDCADEVQSAPQSSPKDAGGRILRRAAKVSRAKTRELLT